MQSKENNEHLVYFYKFIIEGMTERDTDFIMQKFIKKSSNKNAVMLKKNYMLFIADIKIEDGIIGGRIIKIRTGLYRRINIDDGNEWFEELKRQNAIEFETYVVLNLKLNTMIATYNSAFSTYFDSRRSLIASGSANGAILIELSCVFSIFLK